jgi:hypothetical protein
MKARLRLALWPHDVVTELDMIERDVLAKLLPPLNLDKVTTPWREQVQGGAQAAGRPGARVEPAVTVRRRERRTGGIGADGDDGVKLAVAEPRSFATKEIPPTPCETTKARTPPTKAEPEPMELGGTRTPDAPGCDPAIRPRDSRSKATNSRDVVAV